MNTAIQNLGLIRIYLYDSYLPNAFTEIELEGGNTNLTGENGARFRPYRLKYCCGIL